MSSQRKLKCLTVVEKAQIIEAVKSGKNVKKNDIAEELGIPCSTLSTILKKEYQIKMLFAAGSENRKIKRDCKYSDVEECLLKWFKECR